MNSIGFLKSKNDQSVYHLNSTQDKLIARIYVDDLIIMGASETKVKDFRDDRLGFIMFLFGD